MRVISPASHRLLRIEYIVDLPIFGDSLRIIIVNSEVVKSELFEIKELHQLLGDLIECGHGDKEFQMYYDSETVYTTIPKKSRILVFKKGIRFSDYEGYGRSKDGQIEEILKKLNDNGKEQ